MLGKLSHLAEALRYPGGWYALRRAQPRSITSWLMANRLKATGATFKSIIDAGANVGQFARAANMCFPEARVLSFEPLDDVANVLSANLADVPNHKIYRVALGASDGETTFYRNSYSQSSSVHPMLHKIGGVLDGQSQLESLTVPLARLDTLLAGESLAPNVLLKLDLQGNELAALQGAELTLAQCSHVLLEAVFEQEYENEPLFEEIWSHLRDRGFTFERPMNFLRDRRGNIVQMDAMFVRSRR